MQRIADIKIGIKFVSNPHSSVTEVFAPAEDRAGCRMLSFPHWRGIIHLISGKFFGADTACGKAQLAQDLFDRVNHGGWPGNHKNRHGDVGYQFSD